MGFSKRRNFETQESLDFREFETLHFFRDSKVSKPYGVSDSSFKNLEISFEATLGRIKRLCQCSYESCKIKKYLNSLNEFNCQA